MRTTVKEDGEFAGWSYYPEEPFEAGCAGPFFHRVDEQGPVCAFRVEQKHMNGANVAHGGLLMTFADYALFVIAHDELDDGYGLTAAFTSEFLDGAKLGERVEARGDMLRGGRSLVFVRGLVTSEGRPCLNFSGTIKKIKPRG